MITEYLYLIIAIFGVSGITIYFLGKLRISSIVGFLVGGIIIGPSGLNIINDAHDIEALAQIGVILLMFTIGLDFSLKNLLKLKALIFGGGLLQVSLATVLMAVVSFFIFSEPFNKAVFYGILVSLSSTAIVFKMIMDRAEMHTPYGRSVIGMLIFQDLCVVLYILLIPVLAGDQGSTEDIIFTIIKAALVVVIVLISAKWVVPWLLHEIVRTRSRELFIITTIVLCLGTALLTSMLGLSLALGAFLAGVIISESEYSAQTLSDILPFKESFSALFFISIGMLLDLGALFGNVGNIILVVLIIFFAKLLTTAFSAYLTGQTPGNSIRAGLYLAQIGEFSFVTAIAGKQAGLMTEGAYQLFLSSAVLTMMATPFLISSSSRVSSWFTSIRFFRKMEVTRKRRQREYYPRKLQGHVLIIGFGMNGSNLAKVLRASKISYVILELNTDTVRKAKRQGEPIYYGDGTSVEVLRKVHIQSAKIVVVAISDAAATRRVVKIARTENPYVYIIVRTRYVAEVDHLLKLGANEVIPEEFETSIEIFSKVLHQYHLPVNVIKGHVENIRSEGYRALRTASLPKEDQMEKYDLLKDVEVETFQVGQKSVFEGNTIKEINLRAKTGATVIAVERAGIVHQVPPPSFQVKAGDILMLIGKRQHVVRATEYLEKERLVDTQYREPDR